MSELAPIKTTRIVPPPVQELPPTESGRKRWTRNDCEVLERIGFLQERYELLNGEIILKMGQNAPHAIAVVYVVAWLLSLFGRQRVRSQATMEVRREEQTANRPEPDALVLREPLRRTPTGQDVLLVVEIADTSLADDLGFKVELYARAGVEEYWVLNLNQRRLTLFRYPNTEEGTWGEERVLSETETVFCLAQPDAPTTVADLLPEVSETGEVEA
jgi:Uma2 family endonuclease